jgi:hypothetical protein
MVISGKVTDQAGVPLQGVIVKLVTARVADTTAADGRYMLDAKGQTSIRLVAKRSGITGIQYRNGCLVFEAARAGTFNAQLFDLRGARLAAVHRSRLVQGRNVVAFPLEKYNHQLLLLRITNGADVRNYKLTPGMSNGYRFCDVSQDASPGTLSKGAGTIDWLQASKTGFTMHSQAIGAYSGVINITLTKAGIPDFGPNAKVFEPTTAMSTIQSQLNSIFSQQEGSQFGSNRYALLFKPGAYNLDVNVGFYTQVLGLGESPDDVAITGSVHSEADWMGGNATCTFWRSTENVSVIPTSNTPINWAVSQAAPFRRMHIKGSLKLWDGGWASGGYIADSRIDGTVDPGVQQQWLSRNAEWGSWGPNNGSWNFVFVGVVNPPSGTWPNQPYTFVDKTPVIAEKPFLTVDKNGNFAVRVPRLRTDSTKGVSWAGGSTPGTLIPLEQFYVARASVDDAATLNAALGAGKNLLLTPGLYHLKESLKVDRPGTVVLGIGLPSLIPDNGTAALEVADVNGVKIAGVLFEATATDPPTLVQIGEPGCTNSHADDPICLYDIFCRTGGSFNGTAGCLLTINSSNVIGDHFWLWRADHGTGAGWYSNKNANGLIVNGDDVTIYALFVEHTQEYQTIWNGNGGRMYMYQSEMPYDPPSQTAWQHDGVNGWASYKVADKVTTHEGWGLGVYCVFNSAPVIAFNAIETPTVPGVKMTHMLTLRLGGQSGSEISHVINGTGAAATAASRVQRVDYFSGK